MTDVVRIVVLLMVHAAATAVGARAALAQESPLDPVRQAIDEIRYDEAAALLDEVLGRGHLHADSLAEAYRLGGEISAALGDVRQSREHFLRWLTVDPDAQLPSGTSPKIAKTFAEAREQVLTNGALRVRHEAKRGAGTVRVELVVYADPLDQVAGVRVAYGVGQEAELTDLADARGGHRVALDVPDDQWLRMSVIALDEHGNELTVLDDEPVEIAPVDSAAAGVALSEPGVRPWYAQWYTYAAVATVTGGAGLAFGMRSQSDAEELSALNANSAQRTFAEARAIEQRGQRNALLANVSFGAAGLATIGAVVCLWRSMKDTPDATVVAPSASKDGAGLTVRHEF